MSFHPLRRATRDAFLSLRFFVATALCSAGLLFGFSALNVGGASVPRLSGDNLNNPKLARWVVDHTTNGQQAEFLVVLADQADLTDAKSAKSKQDRARRVRDALWNKAQQTQQPILEWLRKHNIEHRPFYIVNAIWVKADAATAAALASRPDVLRVEGNPEIRNQVEPVTPQSAASPEAINTVETGITYSHAPQVWSLGYTGQGIVVAGADTGYRWTHAALKNQYRGWDGATANHDYNWHDSIHSTAGANICGNDSTVPCDDNEHGSHTMGTAVGSDGGNNLIGMAPGARWIGCRNMDNGNGTPARYMECMEFFLAPYPVGGTPDQGNPDLAPDVSTNSWTCPTSEGCSANTLLAAIEAQRAAGIFMVAAAGNSGPTCDSVADPPGIYDDVYTAGALNNGTDVAASFSSRGPVASDGSFRIKPDLAAPGTNVRSSLNTSNTAYGNLSGTSMATPHIAGAVAVLWSAIPLLRNNVAATETLLNASAVPITSTDGCGATGIPNDTYGNGRLDVKAAVDDGLLETTPVNIIWNADGSVTVNFYAGLNRTYRLERKSNLNGTMWSSIPGVNDLTAAGDGPAPLTDPNPGNPQFYRVRLVDYGAR